MAFLLRCYNFLSLKIILSSKLDIPKRCRYFARISSSVLMLLPQYNDSSIRPQLKGFVFYVALLPRDQIFAQELLHKIGHCEDLTIHSLKHKEHQRYTSLALRHEIRCLDWTELAVMMIPRLDLQRALIFQKIQ